MRGHDPDMATQIWHAYLVERDNIRKLKIVEEAKLSVGLPIQFKEIATI